MENIALFIVLGLMLLFVLLIIVWLTPEIIQDKKDRRLKNKQRELMVTMHTANEELNRSKNLRVFISNVMIGQNITAVEFAKIINMDENDFLLFLHGYCVDGMPVFRFDKMLEYFKIIGYDLATLPTDIWKHIYVK